MSNPFDAFVPATTSGDSDSFVPAESTMPAPDTDSTPNPFESFAPDRPTAPVQPVTPKPIQKVSAPETKPMVVPTPIQDHPEPKAPVVPEPKPFEYKGFEDMFNLEATLNRYVGEYDPPQYKEAKERETGTWQDDVAALKGLRNTGADVRRLAQGGLALANAGVQRAAQNLPEGFPGGAGRLGWDEGDTEFAKQFGSEMVKDVAQRYVRPAIRGDLGALLKQVNTNPVSTVVDFAGGKVIGGAAKGIKRAAPAAAKQLRGAAYNMGGRPALRNMRAMQDPGKVFSKMKAEKAVMQVANDVLAKASADYMEWAQKITREIDAAHRYIPKKIKEKIVAGAELTDDAAVKAIKESATTQKFLAKIDEFYDGFAQRMADAGVLPTEFDSFLARWGGAWLAELEKAGIKKTFGQLRKEIAEDASALQEIKDWAFAKEFGEGVKPYWFPIRAAKEVEKFLENAFAPLKKKGENTGFLEPRKNARVADRGGVKTYHGPGTEMDAAKLAKDGLLRMLRVMYVQEAIKEILENPVLGKAADDWVKVNMHELTAKAAAANGVPKPVIAKMLESAAEVEVPQKLAQMLEELADPKRPSPLTKWFLQKPKNFFSKWLLGVDILRPLVQYPQNVALYAWSTIKHPRDIPKAFTAFAMSFQKNAADMVPAHFRTGLKAVQAMEKKGGVLGIPDKGLLWMLEKVESLDNQIRVAQALKLAMDDINKLPFAGERMFSRGLKISIWGQERLKRVFASPALQTKYLKEVNKWLGDYNRQATHGLEQAFDNSVVFPKMVKHLAGVTWAMPFDTPLKTAVMSHITRVFPQVAQEGVPEIYKPSGAVRSTDKEGNPRTGANDKPLIYSKGASFTPFTMGLELAESALSFADPSVDAHFGGVGINPMMNILAEIAFSKNPRSWKPMRDPRNIRAGNYQVPEEVVSKHMSGEREMKLSDFKSQATPPLLPTVARNLMPRQYNPIAKMFEATNPEGPGIPTPFTNPLDPEHGHAPKRGEFGVTLKPPTTYMEPGATPGDTRFDIMQMLFDRLEPTEAFVDEEGVESIEASNIKKAVKGYAFTQEGRDQRKKNKEKKK